MLILSHRGYWKTIEEKNARVAFDRTYSFGFGTETDLRDRDGELVISHDPAREDAMLADDFFTLYRQHAKHVPLALNIKADGLQGLLAAAISKNQIHNYFVFDMSVPDMISYIKTGLRVFTRQSEYEPEPALYNSVQGVWIDCFNSDWVTEAVIESHLKNDKQVCLVSPDLHKRPYKPFWNKLANMQISRSESVMLCTDYPEEARKIFL
jgi:hypothetical protein